MSTNPDPAADMATANAANAKVAERRAARARYSRMGMVNMLRDNAATARQYQEWWGEPWGQVAELLRGAASILEFGPADGEERRDGS